MELPNRHVFLHLSNVHISVCLLFSDAINLSFLQRRCSSTFHKIQRKRPVQEILLVIKLRLVAGLQLHQKRLQHRHFPMNFVKLLRTLFLKTCLQTVAPVFVAVILIDFHSTHFTENATGIS